MQDQTRLLIQRHRLQPHPEGGHYRRVHASGIQIELNGRRRPAMTAICYLLAAGERSRWHRIDGDEVWHWQQGGMLELPRFEATDGKLSRVRLGPADGERLSCIVPAGTWQAAFAPEQTVLMTGTVASGFVWAGLELLNPGSDLARLLALLDPIHPQSHIIGIL